MSEMSKRLRKKIEEAIKDSCRAHVQNVSCASPLIYKAAFENKGSALDRSLSGARHIGRGESKTPERVKKAYFSKMQHYNDFRKLLANGMQENAEHVLSKKNENVVLHGEPAPVKEAYTR